VPVNTLHEYPKLKRALELVGWAFNINQIFTGEFILDNGLAFTQELENGIGKLETLSVITGRFTSMKKTLSQFRKNIEVLRTLFQHCEVSSIAGLMRFLQDDKSIPHLLALKNYLSDLLKKHPAALVTDDWDDVESIAQPECPWADIGKLSDTELNRLLEEWNTAPLLAPAPVSNGGKMPSAPITASAKMVSIIHTVEVQKTAPKITPKIALNITSKTVANFHMLNKNEWSDEENEQSYAAIGSASCPQFK